MNQVIIDCYIYISILIAITDVILSIKSSQKNATTGRYLGWACAAAALVDVSYLVSILSRDYFVVSVMSSLYFISIDVMLVCLLVFTEYFTKNKFSRFTKIALRTAALYALFELLVFVVNPFWEIALGYIPRDTVIARYGYQMKPLYWMHLVYSYTMVAAVLVLLTAKLCVIPQEYRLQYADVILGIVVIVSVNAVFLFDPSMGVFSLLDLSICGYSLTAFLLYWSCFHYSTHGMLNRLKTSVFENIGQGIVLFDYNNELILHNEKAEHLLQGISLNESLSLDGFLRSCDLSLDTQNRNDSYSVQCYFCNSGGERSLRCDIRQLKNKWGKVLGRLFVFSDAALETDLLTGFQNWDSFQRFVREGSGQFAYPTAVAVCDINGLSVINSTAGNSAGDQKIRLLADTMRQFFPRQTYYVRGVEANLVALCGNCTQEQALEYLTLVREHFDGKIQYAVSSVTGEEQDILQVIGEASAAMRTKKLLDRESTHSEMLTSLIRALQECDSDTEHHVRRTQIMGAELGRRIALNDIQQSRLSLLCLLHDIGKIGIPLEILNKPGKLTDEEWAILKTHTEKGYEIANSNNELKQIADEILHHHERWDGKGYPDGLSRESIPLLSRVISVVDAYDAMFSNRAYRAAMTQEQAMEELKRCAGTQFDPFIVGQFLQMLKEHPEFARADTKSAGPVSVVKTDPQEEMQNVRECSVHPVPYCRYLLDASMRIVYVDENFEAITGYTWQDACTMTQADLIPEEERTEYLCRTNAYLAQTPLVFQEHKLRRKDGTDIYVFCYGRVYYDSAARSERSEIIIINIASTHAMKMLTDAEQDKAQTRLRYWERTYRSDPLTGLLNHAAFRSDVEMKLLEGNAQIMMLMIDVDKFKEYNDSHGHHSGDQYLILIAQTLLAAMREGDYTCRMGGDEFAAVLLFGMDTPPERMKYRAQQIFDKVNLTLKSTEGGTGISMGGAIAPPDTNFNQLYEKADAALYKAKRQGRSRMVID